MSNIELLDLPDPVLAKILSHIPGHYEVSSVCKKIYEIDCFNSLKSNLGLLWTQTNDETPMESILSSNRTIRRMALRLDSENSEEIEDVFKISQCHGNSVTELNLFDCFLNCPEATKKSLVQLLKYFPNLKKLVLNFNNIDIEDEDELEFPKLEELEICSKSFILFTKRFPENLKNFGMNFKRSWVPRRNVITDEDHRMYAAKLELIEKLKSIKLEELSFGDSSSLRIEWPEFRSLLRSQQDNLKSLTVRRIAPDLQNEFFQEIKNMKVLKSLKVDEIGPLSVENFSNLTKLKFMEIPNFPDLEVISLIENLSLEELSVQFLPVDVLKYIGQNYPIKSLTIYGAKGNLKFFMENFPLIESLQVKSFNKEISSVISGLYYFDRVCYPNLKILSLNISHSKALSLDAIFEILSAFPNLRELDIIQKMNVSSDSLKNLSKSLGNLRKLIISDLNIEIEQFRTGKSIQALQEISKNLESICLNFRIEGVLQSNEYLDKLRGYYRVYDHDDDYYLALKK